MDDHRRVAGFPRCSVCRVTIQAGQHVVLDADARVHHAECPTVICPVCSRDIRHDEPIRRDGEVLVHSNCWMHREREHVGDSAPAARDRTEIVRARLASGALPSLEPTKAWGGTSSGSVCAGCTAPIVAGQIEYEVQFASTLVFRLHGACFLIWQQERGNVRREISGGSAASPWTLFFDYRIAEPARWDRAAFNELLAASAETVRD